jgi:hypothetical protein
MHADFDPFGRSRSPQGVQGFSPPTLMELVSHVSQMVSSPPRIHPDTKPSPSPQFRHGTQADFDPFGRSLSGQGVQVSTPPTLMELASHVSQTVSSPPRTHSETKPSPRPQEMHGIHADFDPFGLSSSAQGVQIFSPPTLMELALHVSQTVSSPPRMHSDTKPSPRPQEMHGMHADFDPFGRSLSRQGMQDFSPPTLTELALHVSQVVSSPPRIHPDMKPSPRPQEMHGMHADFEPFGRSLSSQGVQEFSPPTLIELALHISQTVSSPPRMHSETKPSPSPHVRHGTQADFDPFGRSLSGQGVQVSTPPTLMELASHVSQLVFSPSTVHVDKKPSPIVHDEHGEGKVDLAGQKVFCGHTVSRGDPSVQKNPGRHVLHEVAPTSSWCSPPAHATQALCPGSG